MKGTDVFLNHNIDSIEKIEDFTSGKLGYLILVFPMETNYLCKKRTFLIDGSRTSSTSNHKNMGNVVAVDFVSLCSKTAKRIAEAERDIKEGNVCTLEELKAEFGLE